MENFASYLANLPKTPIVEAVQSLYESCFGPWNFKSVQELRDFVDQKTYERFKLYSKNEVASGKTPFGSLEAIKAIDMDTFLKSVGDKGYDIEDDMKNQLVDANYINNLSYDWFICLFNMKVLGWNKPAMYEADDRMSGSTWDDVERIHVYHAADPSMDMDIKLDSLWATRQKDSVTRQDVIDRFVEDVQDFNRWLLSSKDGGALITSAAIKFKGDPDEVTVKIPCHGTDINTYENNLYESVDNSQTVFKTLEELRDYLDRAAYGTFENSEYDQYEQEPYGSLENIQEVDMADFVKDMSGMNHDIQSLVGQQIDDKTLNQLVYDWFVCLHTRGTVGWQYNWN